MTDKQIIIDGVPVQDCCYFDYENDGYEDSCYIHQNECSAQNCYYKQLKRAEQRIVELNKTIQAKEQECEELKKIINEAKNSKLDLNSFFAIEATVGEYQLKLDQLKAENEELEKELRQKKMTILMNNDHYFEVDQENKKLKQTLTEIKEIAEKNLNIHTCAFKGCGYDLITEQILQKISECEAGNEEV